MSSDLEYIAKTYYKRGEYDRAIRVYEELLKKTPHNHDWLISYANCFDLLGKKDEAIKFYKKALHYNKKSIIALSNIATAYYELGNLKKAQNFSTKALELDSKNISSMINMGNIFYQNGKYLQALDSYFKAYEIKNDYYIAVINIANTNYELENFSEAILYANKALELDSKSVQAYTILGNCYLELDDSSKAAIAFEDALKLDSNDAWIYNSLSQAYQKKGNLTEAMKLGFLAIEKSPKDDSQHINFGYLLYESAIDGFKPQAIEYAQKWLDKYGKNKIAVHMGNAIINGKNISRANDEYLKNIFDVFAKDFDTVLAGLEYLAPAHVHEIMTRVYPVQKKTKLRILDAGCGTGLCGAFLKEYACYNGLQGVDISTKMLDVAKAKKLYNKLYEDELIHFLSKHKNTYNLIVSSDVFTYFGDLNELIFNAQKALKKGGRIIFTVSENDVNQEGYLLHLSGRFLHNENYIKMLLETAGFSVEFFERKKLRNEGSEAVYGFIVSAIRI